MPWCDWDLDAAWSLDGHCRLVLSAQLIDWFSGMVSARSLDVEAHSAIVWRSWCRLRCRLRCPLVCRLVRRLSGRDGFGNVSVSPMPLVHFVPLYTHRYWLGMMDVHNMMTCRCSV